MENINRNNNKPNDKIFEILFDKDEITWQTILFDLVKTEQMDPWDIDIALLTKRYVEMLKTLKELNFMISGKVLLAAALLLRIKSERLVGKDIDDFDRLLTPQEEEDFLYEEAPESLILDEEKPSLIPRTPQPRKRKVSIYDLVGALQKALEVKRRRVIQSIPAMDLEVPEKKKDISKVIGDLYLKIKKFFTSGKKKLTFTNLVPSDKKEDKVYTFVPLLHLSHQRKVDLHQEEHFGEIEVLLRTKREVDKDLSA